MWMRMVWVVLSLFLSGYSGCFFERVGRRYVTGFEGSDTRRIGYVDTRLGTGGLPWTCGFNSPAVSTPLGLVKVGPDTQNLKRIVGTAGYHYWDLQILGFSHTRLSGTGAWDGGVLRVIPSNTLLDASSIKRHVLGFRHDEESAIPGYYSVKIRNKDVLAEMTSTAHVGYHRYTFNQTGAPHLIVDLTSHLSTSGKVNAVHAEVNYADRKITGYLTLSDSFSSRYGGLKHYFVIESELAFSSHQFFGTTESTGLSVDQDAGTLYLDLGLSQTAGTPFTLKVALSTVDADGATSNLNREVDTDAKTFDTVRTENQATWETLFAKAQVQGEDSVKKLFYSNLYRAFIMPTEYSDYPRVAQVVRRYRGFDGAVHTTDGSRYLSDFSLWDTFRTVHPLYNLIAQDIQTEAIKSLILIADDSGRLPRWSGGGGHTDSMLGFSASIILSEAYQKGITGYDTDKAFQYASQAARIGVGSSEGKECLADYTDVGYCPADARSESVSYTLEYAYADHALALFADAKNEATLASFFRTRSRNYRNLWNSTYRAFVPRNRNGDFLKEFSLNDLSYLNFVSSTRHFVEGSPNHWRWYVPQDPETLKSLFGDYFVSDLEEFFTKSTAKLGVWYPSSYYWHGNEHDIHSVFLFNAANRPDLTQKWARWILDNKYSLSSIGLDGNDDGGTLSSWYVLAALGIYPIAGTTRYQIGSPIISGATLSIGNQTLTIEVGNYAPKNIYVKSVTINGTKLTSPWFEHSAISGGGTLRFEMSATPQTWSGS